jgi:hypothetical protein
VKQPECHHESALLQALHDGAIDPVLQQHATACPSCSELLHVASELLHCPQPSGDPPPAGLIWWRAQLDARRRLSERSLAPIRIFQKIAAVTSLLTIAIASQWIPALPGWAIAICISLILVPAAGLAFLFRKA